MMVAAQTKTVKRINPQRSGGRSVTTERTGYSGNASSTRPGYGSSQSSRRNAGNSRGGRSVTINSSMTEDSGEDYDELY